MFTNTNEFLQNFGINCKTNVKLQTADQSKNDFRRSKTCFIRIKVVWFGYELFSYTMFYLDYVLKDGWPSLYIYLCQYGYGETSAGRANRQTDSFSCLKLAYFYYIAFLNTQTDMPSLCYFSPAANVHSTLPYKSPFFHPTKNSISTSVWLSCNVKQSFVHT